MVAMILPSAARTLLLPRLVRAMLAVLVFVVSLGLACMCVAGVVTCGIMAMLGISAMVVHTKGDGASF
jgi:hypothetical protein